MPDELELNEDAPKEQEVDATPNEDIKVENAPIIENKPVEIMDVRKPVDDLIDIAIKKNAEKKKSKQSKYFADVEPGEDVIPKPNNEPKKGKKYNPKDKRRCVPKKRFTTDDGAFIAKNFNEMTDAEIGSVLNREAKAIAEFRKRHNLFKNVGNKDEKEIQKNATELIGNNKNMTPDQKRSVFTKKFKDSIRYGQVREILSDNEFDFYTEKYIEFLVGLGDEDLKSSEYDTLHQLIIEQILAHRILMKQKKYEENNPSNVNGIIIQGFAKEYDTHIGRFTDLQKSLKVSRDQRLKVINDDSQVTLVKMVELLKESRTRQHMGDEWALLDKLEKDWKKTAVDEGLLLVGKDQNEQGKEVEGKDDGGKI